VLTRRVGDQAQAGVVTVSAFADGLTCASGSGVRVRPGCALLAFAFEALECRHSLDRVGVDPERTPPGDDECPGGQDSE
jgi:hypothetical protein